MDKITEWMKRKLTGIIRIHLHEGGIRKVFFEQEIKEK